MKGPIDAKRRRFLASAAVGAAAAATAFPAPAIAQDKREWKMVTSWPKGLPGVGTGAERIAQRITEMSDGRLTVKVYAAGEIVPPLECFSAVAEGKAEMGHDASYYHIGKHRQAPFFTTVPFGLTANELSAWIHFGGGQELWDELYAGFGLKPFLAGNTGTQMLGWYRKELKTAEDYQGLKVRMAGLGAEVVKRLGATVVTVPGGEIFQALQNGTVDAAEWVGPYNDQALGLNQVAEYYYGPGFQEPSAGLELIVNKTLYDELPRDLKQIVAVAAQAAHDDLWAEYTLRNGEALANLISKGTKVARVPNELMVAMGTASGEVLAEERDKADAIGKKIFESFLKARGPASAYTRIGEQAMANARALAYKYIE
ncbi:TRAP transporter substrate-binding protein [Zavarzinia sp.]|uniref:TRAP transporter substrate-binding protein n=1 Tax=Zavarzinia sp. TaxID=2027920 RepID=UPI003BB4DA21|nr:TRAP transporter substrate-binding protein [Zavarzinia sp.]